ncbi:glycoside hydrolase family 5 [Methylobacterium sp. 4-46]|uniref:glycoside hydrolase family 5 protein n=1 Tax=unclassified Methylobacterium TaxID=2615210 RepID=UPI000152D2E5|nr:MULTISPECIES: glycoside hydrolase family 5 protein [Methylobacterium]ACA15606.1 glycoside hydrolase family 5 [Methylobacterium sp. 4-46]WFT81318.1 glycoside hydrolase family 5 protein [Methylobacterium nodulans]
MPSEATRRARPLPAAITRGAFLAALAGGVAAAAGTGAGPARAGGAVRYPGVNLSGGEFGDIGRPLGQGYIYPPNESFAYYAGRGMKLVRIPFKIERVQPEPLGALSVRDADELARCVRAAKAAGLLVVLDAHNFGKRDGKPIEARDLTNLWSRLAARFRDEPSVAYGLMNEPVAFAPPAWRPVVDALVKAIRDGGSRQLLMVPGAGWSGAHSWVSDGNAAAFEDFQDPHFLFEVHQYLDRDNSGSNPQDYAPGAGATRLAAFTDWARRRGAKAFLGEFGFALPAGEAEARALLSFVAAHTDVWQAYAYWAGGPWWGDYAFSIEPGKEGDKPQMALLRHFM